MIYLYIWIAAQIILESMPASSSGNLRLIELCVKKCGGVDLRTIASSDFEHLLHGAVLIIISIFFWKRFWRIVLNLSRTYKILLRIIFLGFLADLITLIVYLAFLCLGMPKLPLWLGFFITALMLYSLKFCLFNKYEKINEKKALLIGLAQGLAFLPGVSRMGSTIVIASWMRIPKLKALEISLLLEFPIAFFGFIKGVYLLSSKNLLKSYINPYIIIVIAFSTFISFFALKFVRFTIKVERFWMFAFYPFLISLLSFILIYF